MSSQPCLMQWLDRTQQGFYMYSIEDGAKYINVDSKPSKPIQLYANANQITKLRAKTEGNVSPPLQPAFSPS